MEATAGACADRLIAELSRPIWVGDFDVEIGASVGLAVFPAHSRDADTLFRYADMALYEAKQTARGTWSPYSRSLGQGRRTQGRAGIGGAPRRRRRATSSRYFQPIVDMRTGKIVKLEMLARWQHPTHGAVPPDRFIPIIEQFGLINDVHAVDAAGGAAAPQRHGRPISRSRST